MRLRSLPIPLCCFACAHTPDGPLAGASDAWNQKTHETRVAPKVEAPVWQDYAELVKRPPLNAQPFTSRGHQLGTQVNLLANAVGSETYKALVTDSVLPEGSLLGELPSDASTPGAHGFVMQKRADGWSYLELDSGGRVLEQGRPARCEGCHALAPADHVFGLPRP